VDIHSYLTFDGRCAEAFAEYARILGGTVEFSQTFGESPMSGDMPPEWQGKVMHAQLRVGDQRIMGSDAPPAYFEKPQGISVSLMFADAEEGRRVFDALAAGGTVKMAYAPTFWAKGFGMLTDRFGIPWMVNAGDAAA
jgi:PhnB protein